MVAGHYSERGLEAGAGAGRRFVFATFTHGLLWAAGFGVALWLMLHWSTTMHTDFAQNAWLPARLLMQGANLYFPTHDQITAALGIYSSQFTGFNSGADFHFIYPAWVAIAFWPLATMPLDVATAVFRALSLVLLFWACAHIIRSTNPVFRQSSLAVWLALGLALFLCFFYRADIQNLFAGQFAVVELALLAGVWGWLFSSAKLSSKTLFWGDALAGLALAILATKPQATGLAILLLVLWAISRRRFTIVVSAGVALLTLLLLPLVFYPTSLGDWFSVAFLQGQASSQAPYSVSVWGLSYALLGGKGSAWVPVSVALSLLGIIFLLPSWRRDLMDKTSPVPASLMLTLCMNSLISPYMLAYEHVLLLMPALVVLAQLGLPRGESKERAGVKLLRLSLYAWIGVLPLVTGYMQTVALDKDHDYPIVLQSASIFLVCWATLRRRWTIGDKAEEAKSAMLVVSR